MPANPLPLALGSQDELPRAPGTIREGVLMVPNSSRPTTKRPTSLAAFVDLTSHDDEDHPPVPTPVGSPVFPIIGPELDALAAALADLLPSGIRVGSPALGLPAMLVEVTPVLSTVTVPVPDATPANAAEPLVLPPRKAAKSKPATNASSSGARITRSSTTAAAGLAPALAVLAFPPPPPSPPHMDAHDADRPHASSSGPGSAHAMLTGTGRLPPRPAAVPGPDPTYGTRTQSTTTARAIPAAPPAPAPPPRAQSTPRGHGRGRGGKRGRAVERVGKPILMPTRGRESHRRRRR
ncbi:hypothetical protein GGF31_006448 [Allomyces arbusculus]|nr:hypothetical protein GGF31_006448 [Allomyces arbusculus]